MRLNVFKFVLINALMAPCTCASVLTRLLAAMIVVLHLDKGDIPSPPFLSRIVIVRRASNTDINA